MTEKKARKFVTGTMSKAAIHQSKKVKKGNAMPIVLREDEEEFQKKDLK